MAKDMAKYYDGIASGYEELHGEEQLRKLELIGKYIETDPKLKDIITPKLSLLDVGCGTGISTGFFKVKERQGIDPSKKLVDAAIRNYPGTKFHIGNAERMPYKNRQFDIVISFTAIQNFDDIQKGLDEIKRVGKDRFILTFLKKSLKREMIEGFIQKKFNIIKRIEEEKDIIYFCR
jgi:ubiquinone/menaquinone biosynthesis C-methylase UbiE